MKQVYPPRHPASLDADTAGQTRTSRDGRAEAPLPHEADQSSHSQESATPAQKDVGKKAFDNATDGTQDTDRGPLMDKVYNEKVAPSRGPAEPRE